MNTSLDVVIPGLNEEKDLPPSVRELHGYLARYFRRYEWRIMSADNGSTDSTPEIAKYLSEQYSRVDYMRLEKKGRGRALRKAWLESGADIVGYMDVDLSTNLDALPGLVEAIDTEGYDVAIGSRFKKGAQVVGRPSSRELVSRSYSLIFRAMFQPGFRDAQCGFKALTRSAACRLVPLIKDTGWFFDTELLVLAEKTGYRIKEIPVMWIHDAASRVKIVRTAYEDMKGLLRLRFGGLSKAVELLSRQRRVE